MVAAAAKAIASCRSAPQRTSSALCAKAKNDGGAIGKLVEGTLGRNDPTAPGHIRRRLTCHRESLELRNAGSALRRRISMR